jgi:hypothetical protein
MVLHHDLVGPTWYSTHLVPSLGVSERGHGDESDRGDFGGSRDELMYPRCSFEVSEDVADEGGEVGG